ncbi:S1 family peptidase [Phormidium sp. CCY1219]|uniref:S1 family peptidase n=1 Tax=Phormidium sp. CCY1219 TaxID=2886104 RepID=UPI002D1F820E|nr:serine protease [Phormidium sp. CCY1219]MEB3829215.1 serine protease [Phormidium sp. CCY1219]
MHRAKSGINWRWGLGIACGGVFALGVLLEVPQQRATVGPQQPPTAATPQARDLQQVAQSISVRILAEEPLGSGILIRQEGATYTVVTNEHVLRFASPPYQVETPDGRRYPLTQMRRGPSLEDNDLALLQFRTPGADYAIAQVGTHLTPGEPMFAGGFPWDSLSGEGEKGFVFRKGTLWRVLDRALAGGYRIGYTNEIEKGMSGGPLLNQQGEVVGIHGMHAYPLWGDPYIYPDGSQPEASLRDQMTRYSWGIPMQTLRELAPFSAKGQTAIIYFSNGR